MGIDKDLYKDAGRPSRRVRQHSNPLRSELQVPVGPLDWAAVYADPSLPLAVDVGAGYGRFLLALAAASGAHNCRNVLGLEIRDPLVERGNRWAARLGLDRRAHFVVANATVSAAHMLPSYPGGVDLVTIQFPDPHFKRKHRKRRVVQAELVAAVARVLRPGGRLLLQSDVLEVAEDMRDAFEAGAAGRLALAGAHAGGGAVFFQASARDGEGEAAPASDSARAGDSGWAAGGWLRENPLGVPTERELHVLAQGVPVYRVLLERSAEAPSRGEAAGEAEG